MSVFQGSERRALEDCVCRLVDDMISVFRAEKQFPSPAARFNEARRLTRLARDLLSVSPLPLSLDLILDLERAVERAEERMEKFGKANSLE